MTRPINLRSIAALALIAAAGSVPMTASAHIDMLAPLVGRNGDQKARPCEGKGRGPVYMFEPGATITLGVDEGVGHDSYFRIAFDNDGSDSFKDPASIDPINPARDGTGRKCMTDSADKCGQSDFCNVVSNDGGPTVLWDNLNPHLASFLDGKQWKWTVTLPNIECSNCTLQIIQVMEDILGHGPYDGESDLYYRCVDIVLKRGAGGTTGTASGPAQNTGINCLAGQPSDAGVPDASTVPDASAGNDAGTASGTAGGSTPGGSVPGGSTIGGSSSGGGAPGSSGTSGGAVAGSAGAAGGAGASGGAAGTTGGGATTTGGGAVGGGTTAAGTTGGVAGGTTAGVPPIDDTPSDEGCDCAVSDTSPRYGNLISMSLLALALLARRRRLSR